MAKYSAPALVACCILAVMLGSHTSLAQYCSVPTGFTCISSTQYVACAESKVVVTTDPVACTAGLVCYGSAAAFADICKTFNCNGKNGNITFPDAPKNVYLTCINSKPVAVSTCCNGTVFNATSGICEAIAAVAPPCTGIFQFLPDPSSCNHYYLCGFDKNEPATRTKCPSVISRFDSTYRICRYKYVTPCGHRPDLDE